MKLTPAEWTRPSIPEAENFAASPLLRRSDEPTWRKPFKFPEKRPPFRGDKAPFETDFEAWRQYCIEQKWIEAVDGESAPAATLRALDIAFGDDWQQLRAAVERPRCQFVLPENDWSAGPTELVPLLAMAQFAAFRAEVHIALGDAAAAAEDIHVALRAASLTREEPTLISHLVRIAVAQLGLEMIKRGIIARQWNEEALARFAADLAEIHPLDQHAFALQTERAFANQVYERLRGGGTNELMKLFQLEPVPAWHRLLAAYPDGWLYDNQTRSAECIDALLARIDPDAERFQPTRSPFDPQAKPAGRFESIRYFLAFMLMPAFEPLEARSLRAHTQVQCATVAIALERTRLATGSYPESLDALGAVPVDVIDGEPLRYRHDGAGGYVLYSIALNGRDDAGGESGERNPASQPDWVWSVRAR